MAQHVELAKDVSAMANAEGGALVVGLQTEPLAGERTDRVSAVGRGEMSVGRWMSASRPLELPSRSVRKTYRNR
jgi:hypothetical protein